MLYYIYEMLFNEENYMRILRVFRSITIRVLIAFILSFIFVIAIGKPFINFLKRKKYTEEIRTVGPTTHFSKKGTPTMGGVLIVSSILFTVLITGNLTNKFIWILLIVTILFSSIGFLDDFLKWSEQNKKGLSAKKKIIGQLSISLITWSFLYSFPLNSNINELTFSLVNPFLKNSSIFIGAFLYLIFICILLTATSNAVNITDGLDGLVIGPVMIVAFILGIIAYLTGRVTDSAYLNLYYIEGASEILVFISSLIGAGLGFLWYNFYPAQIFMGDTGSLTLGGLLGVISILLKQELLLPIIGLVFVIEAGSVILQVGSYKTRKKRIFKMAPIHHHFELDGLPETKVTMRFWIVSLLLGIVGLIILKLR